MADEMLGRRLARLVQPLDGAAERAQGALRELLRARIPLRDALDGVWLGTPLHPALTDVPVGAATTALLLDAAGTVTSSPELAVAADRALAVAVLGTIPAAVTGVADWRDLRGTQRQMGLGHGLLNVAALALNGCSLLLRGRGRRGAARAASGLAFAVAATAAHVGGELSFGLGVRVNRTAWESPPDDFTGVLDSSELHGDALRRVELDDAPVLLARSGGRVCAIAATCSHLGGPLDEGERDGDRVTCPWHGSQFDLCTGAVTRGPAVFAQPRYEAREREGRIEIRRAG